MSDEKIEVKLGDAVKDRVSGLKGIAIADCTYLNGCRQIGIRPKMGTDGKFPEAVYVDIESVIRVGNGLNKGTKKKKKPTGGKNHMGRSIHM